MNPHTSLVACIKPALMYGEERIYLDEEIYSELREGLITAVFWFRHWYDRYEKDRNAI
jgi:hypothetical protein